MRFAYLFIGSMALMVAPSDGAQFVQTYSANSFGTTLVNVAPFDTSLGTLTSVDLIFSGAMTGNITFAPAPGYPATILFSPSLDLSEYLNVDGAYFSAASGYQSLASGTQTIYGPKTFGFDLQLQPTTILSADPGLFVSPIVWDWQNLPYVQGVDYQYTAIGFADLSSSFGLAVAYNYAPPAPPEAPAVPEPATWAMMLMGFGAVGFGARRKKRIADARA